MIIIMRVTSDNLWILLCIMYIFKDSSVCGVRTSVKNVQL